MVLACKEQGSVVGFLMKMEGTLGTEEDNRSPHEGIGMCGVGEEQPR